MNWIEKVAIKRSFLQKSGWKKGRKTAKIVHKLAFKQVGYYNDIDVELGESASFYRGMENMNPHAVGLHPVSRIRKCGIVYCYLAAGQDRSMKNNCNKAVVLDKPNGDGTRGKEYR